MEFLGGNQKLQICRFNSKTPSFVGEAYDLKYGRIWYDVKQGDQIGRNFAYWKIVLFGQFFLNRQVAKIFGLLLTMVKSYYFKPWLKVMY
jgi:hypothetical protein